jgi:hypothetical protein
MKSEVSNFFRDAVRPSATLRYTHLSSKQNAVAHFDSGSMACAAESTYPRLSHQTTTVKLVDCSCSAGVGGAHERWG